MIQQQISRYEYKQLTNDDFTVNNNAKNDDYIYSRLWEVNDSGTDFTGYYELTFTPQCRDATEIDDELNQYCID